MLNYMNETNKKSDDDEDDDDVAVCETVGSTFYWIFIESRQNAVCICLLANYFAST